MGQLCACAKGARHRNGITGTNMLCFVNCLMRECSMVDSAHFTVPASGEIFLALNISSVTVQMSTGKTP